jgi:hypothetical protein
MSAELAAPSTLVAVTTDRTGGTQMNGLVAALRRTAVLAPAAAALVLLVASSAGAAGSYRDPTGDNNGAPDVSKVAVTNDTAGTLTFDIGIVNLPSPAEVQTYLFLDTDRNGSTGATALAGADYAFVVDESDDSFGFYRWNGSDWDGDIPCATVRVSSGRTNVHIVVNRSELGGAGAFNFWVGTRAGEARDEAPDDGTWSYSLAAGGPEIRGVLVTNKPLLPKAGRPFTVTATGVRLASTGGAGAVPQPERYSCRATLGGKPIVGTGVGRCTWKLPKTARAQKLAVVVTVSYQGATKSIPFSYRVT